MPEVRRRGLSDQIGVGADRTQRGAAQGGGIGPTIARLQQAVRSRTPSQTTSSSGALTLTEFIVEGGTSSVVNGDVDTEGLYIVRAEATVTVPAGLRAAIDLYGAGAGGDRIDYRAVWPAEESSFDLFATGVAWCNEGVTLSSSVDGTITDHRLVYTLLTID